MASSDSRCYLVFCNTENRRFKLFSEALAEAFAQGTKRNCLPIAYSDLLSHYDDLAGYLKLCLVSGVVKSGVNEVVVRFDSPGENFGVEKGLIALGSQQSNRIDASTALNLSFDKGAIRYMKEWFQGFQLLLEKAKSALETLFKELDIKLLWMNHPESILPMMDKSLCHRTLSLANVSVPNVPVKLAESPELSKLLSYVSNLNNLTNLNSEIPQLSELLGPTSVLNSEVTNSDLLLDKMSQLNINKVFIKQRFGSSASGVIAFHHGARPAAYAPLEVTSNGLYNSLSVKRYSDLDTIKKILDLLLLEGIHIEQWIPKSAHHGRVFDLRALAVCGELAHLLGRQSKGPITNLHLGNSRLNVNELTNIDQLRQSCSSAIKQISKVFNQSMYSGIDFIVPRGTHRVVVVDVNPFGDLIPNLKHQGMSTYEMENCK